MPAPHVLSLVAIPVADPFQDPVTRSCRHLASDFKKITTEVEGSPFFPLPYFLFLRGVGGESGVERVLLSLFLPLPFLPPLPPLPLSPSLPTPLVCTQLRRAGKKTNKRENAETFVHGIAPGLSFS